MKYFPYTDYKSVDNLIGRIPNGWRVERLHDVATIKTSNVDKKSAKYDAPVKLCNYVDVYYHSKITSEIDFMISTASENEIERFTLHAGDVVFTKDSEDPYDIGIPTLIKEEIENLVCGYHLSIVKPELSQIIGGFVYYALETELSKFQFTLASNGVTRFGLTYQGTKNLLLPIPSLDEQKSIVDFLDYKIVQINRLIDKKKELIEKLNEQRITMITQAVTKGIDLNVTMKNTEVNWLGDIPKHWGIKRLRFAIESNPVKSEINDIERDDLVSFVPMNAVGEYGGIRLDINKPLNDVYDGYTYFRNDDVVIAKITPCFENGKGAKAEYLTNGIAFGTTELHVMRPLEGYSSRWLFYLSICHAFREIGASEMYGAGGQKRVPESFIKNFRLGIPSYEEQESIADFIDTETQKINDMLRVNNQAIDRLIEYKKALISSTVTGQIDVRGVEIPNKEVA